MFEGSKGELIGYPFLLLRIPFRKTGTYRDTLVNYPVDESWTQQGLGFPKPMENPEQFFRGPSKRGDLRVGNLMEFKGLPDWEVEGFWRFKEPPCRR